LMLMHISTHTYPCILFGIATFFPALHSRYHRLIRCSYDCSHPLANASSPCHSCTGMDVSCQATCRFVCIPK
jgi:hypothetical protein